MTLSIDEDVTERLPPPLRALGHDVIHTREVGRKGRSDPQQLAFASEQGRVIVTCNDDDFVLLHEAWLLCPSGRSERQSSSHAGIAIVPNGSRILDAELISIVDQFAQDVELTTDRLFRWRREAGWQEITES